MVHILSPQIENWGVEKERDSLNHSVAGGAGMKPGILAFHIMSYLPNLPEFHSSSNEFVVPQNFSKHKDREGSYSFKTQFR